MFISLVGSRKLNMATNNDKKDLATKTSGLQILKDHFHNIIDENIVDGNLEEWENLIQKVIRSKDKNQNTALHKAAEKGNLEMVKYLIAQRAQLGAKNAFESTALHNAATNGM